MSKVISKDIGKSKWALNVENTIHNFGVFKKVEIKYRIIITYKWRGGDPN